MRGTRIPEDEQGAARTPRLVTELTSPCMNGYSLEPAEGMRQVAARQVAAPGTTHDPPTSIDQTRDYAVSRLTAGEVAILYGVSVLTS